MTVDHHRSSPPARAHRLRIVELGARATRRAVAMAVFGVFGAFGCGGRDVAPRVPVEESSVSNPSAPSAVAELDEGERTIEVAGGDCASACRGVDEMIRARVRLCAPVTSSCADAERREGDARRKVAAFCAPCAPTP